MSETLDKGTPVMITIERHISGFGNPVTDQAAYDASFATFVNGQSLNDLGFTLKKAPGKGQTDQVSGKQQATYIINAKVGDTFTIESLMEVVDRVKADGTSYQMLNGADAVQHQITIEEQHRNAVCLLSASGKLNAGNCKQTFTL
jgi:hypothetical protein